MFDGYNDPILDIKTAIETNEQFDNDMFDDFYEYENYENHEDLSKNTIPIDKFGWFYQVKEKSMSLKIH